MIGEGCENQDWGKRGACQEEEFGASTKASRGKGTWNLERSRGSSYCWPLLLPLLCSEMGWVSQAEVRAVGVAWGRLADR